ARSRRPPAMSGSRGRSCTACCGRKGSSPRATASLEVEGSYPMPSAFAIEHVRTGADRGEIRIRGSLRFTEAAPLWSELRRLESSAAPGETRDLELSAVQRLDGG